jgi:ribA/ribD-fused uncharacterized protein
VYHKALLFDPSKALEVAHAESPAEAQRLGRELKNFDKKKWDEVNDGIVERANYLKFGQDRDMKALKTLLETGGKELIEASPKDRIWGIGYGKEDAWEHRNDWGTNRSVYFQLVWRFGTNVQNGQSATKSSRSTCTRAIVECQAKWW